jgi:hypothetical protein
VTCETDHQEEEEEVLLVDFVVDRPALVDSVARRAAAADHHIIPITPIITCDPHRFTIIQGVVLVAQCLQIIIMLHHRIITHNHHHPLEEDHHHHPICSNSLLGHLFLVVLQVFPRE